MGHPTPDNPLILAKSLLITRSQKMRL